MVRTVAVAVAWCVSERIAVVKLKVAKEFYTLVQAYGPTDITKSEAKDQFNAEMQRVVENVGRREILIVMGDINARVEDEEKGYESMEGIFWGATRWGCSGGGRMQ